MAKYLDPKADVTFKNVFGEHKNLDAATADWERAFEATLSLVREK